MCTAVTYKTKDFYFGRTLDYDFSYGEEITVTPRNYAFHFREMGDRGRHYAMIGMAHVENAYPLYYDAVNEKGLGMAGLNFPGSAVYKETQKEKENIGTFELIPWVLCQCGTVKEARRLLHTINITDIRFREGLPLAELHWIIADQDEVITVEAMEEGIFVYDNPTGVLTNNPPFPLQMFALRNYMHVSPLPAQNHFSNKLELKEYGRGMGALGLPGDLSSQSRFIRAAFTRLNAISGETEMESVSQFFHILGSVEQQRGCCDIGNQTYEITIYSACCNATKGIYYYTTYENHQITAVDMHRENLEGSELIQYPLILGEQIRNQN